MSWLLAHGDLGTRYWFFNTNETHSPDAYRRMPARQAAVYGYADGPRALQSAEPGDQIMAYISEQSQR